ncbi:adenosine deaminase family protein [Microbacterium sp. LMI1-1-1.1]|uniref:adenosine deaminase family protein n=1 Tax=Microbacterium sp. LMI1-1-1.1 TaxID=3135223 RepID=UPI003465F215
MSTAAATTAAVTVPDEWLRRIPKVDLHCHLIGTVRASTFAELARREGLALPAEPERVFADINSLPPDPALYRDTVVSVPQGRSVDEPEVSYSLFQVSAWVVQLLRSPEDLTRIVYEAFEDAHRSGTRHLELFFDSVPEHLAGLGYRGSVEAYADGIRLAERDFGMTGRMIAGIDRSRSGEEALALVREVVDNPHEYVAGIGLDNLETAGPPERFVDAYRLAGEAGLGRTAHSSEHAPTAANTTTCLDLLGCDRIDHGYFVLEDPAVVERVRRDGVVFTVASTTSRRSWRPWRRASIRAMLDAGLRVTPCSDDPGMFPTTLTDEYRLAAGPIGATHAQLRDMVRNGVEASWLPEGERAALLADVTAELDALDAELGLA